MAQPRLISDYLAALSRQLPAPIVEELADGLTETCQSYLRQGLAPDDAARYAVAEFGDPAVIAAAYTATHPTRRAATTMLRTGPAVGACWAAALLTSRAWPGYLPALAPAGLWVVTVIGLLATSALGTRYRLAARAGVAGCVGTAALDGLMIAGAIVILPSLTWIAAAAVAASSARLAFSARALTRALTPGAR
jgi:hypothetical protein